MRGAADPWQGGTRGRGWQQWRLEHREALADGVAYITSHWLASAFVWLSLAVSLAVPGLLLILERSLGAQLADRAEQLTIQIYFQPGVADAALEEVLQDVRQMPEVAAVESISPSAALAELQQTVGVDLRTALGDVNPIPASARVQTRANAGAAGDARLVERIQQLPLVDEVASERDWRERLQALVRFLARLGWMLGVLLAVGAALIAHASVRMAIDARLGEIRVHALLGAERAALRRPFVYLGLLYGGGGGLLAAMLLSAGLLALEGPLAEVADSYAAQFSMTGFDLPFVLLLVLAAVLLGLAGALVAAGTSIRRAADAADW